MLIAEEAGPSGDNCDTARKVEGVVNAVIRSGHPENSLQARIGLLALVGMPGLPAETLVIFKFVRY
jgi:hypothetical protein